MISIYNLFESYPNNPNTIILQNEFYPKGLIEQQVYSYYLSQKNNILEQVKNRNVMLYIMTDINNPVIKRKIDKTNFISLNKSNYDQIITGRTISIHETMNKIEDHGVIDIDYHDFHECKLAVIQIYDFLSSNKLFKNISIRFTGKNSFHIIINLNKKLEIDTIRTTLRNTLINSPFASNYIISGFRSLSKINLDLSSNKFNGNHICLNALSTIGLRCMEINRQDVINFNKEIAKI